MNNGLGRRIASVALMTGLTAAPLVAQTPDQSNFAARGTELGGSIGTAFASSETAPVVAGMAGWSITRWVTLEARGGWFARGSNTNGVGADVGALVNVIARRRTTPYVGAAFGLYRASIDTRTAHVSDFYRMRMLEPAGGATSMRTFTDPAWRFSAGVDLIRHRNISIRPEASVVLVHRNGSTDSITSVGVRLGYLFEDRPVTPTVR
jgi:hypothetical protein